MLAYYGPEWESFASRIVGRWCPSFSGATGLQLPDTMGRNHGVLTNFAHNGNDAYVASPDKVALNLDGSNDTVIVADSPALNPTTGLTLSAWVRQVGEISYKQIFAKASGTATSQRQYGLYVVGGSGPGAANSLGFELRTSTTVESSFGVIPSGVWTHVAGTYNGSLMAWYVNGVSVGTAAQSGTIATQASNLFLGQFATGGFSTFNGQIDDALILNVGLTASEFRFLFEQGRGGGLLYQPPRRRSVAAVIAALVLACETGNYSLTGQAAGLFASRVLAADQAQYILSGNAANTTASRLLSADPASYTATGNEAATICARLLDGGAAAYALTGTDAGLIANRKLTADQAVCFLAGNNAELLRSLKLNAGSMAIQLDGPAPSLLADRKISADGAQYILVVSDANLGDSASGVAPYYYLFMMRGPQ
jgi:hypothetical protein